MNILVINCGSSSLKFQVIDTASETMLAKGLCERIGSLTKDERKVYIRKVVSMYEDAFDECEDEFTKIADRKRERAERRKTRVKSRVHTEDHTAEQAVPNVGTSYPNYGNVNREQSDGGQGTNGYVQR